MAKSSKFGTFGGVFTPSILTILGVIMYLRLPFIIGQAGLYATLGIIIIAHIISATTGLSVSSIATDKKVKAGGTYYMISRSLGLPIGGTLGIALFVGLSFSVSLYLIGFAESFLNYFQLDPTSNNIRITGSIMLFVVTTITFISTSLAMKTQYFIMAAIILSLLSILFGDHEFTPTTPLLVGSEGVNLMVLFGIFFPAVTGFEAGVSMSGDLKDPKKSIPGGSIAAIVVGLVVYIALAIFFSFTVSQEALANDPQVLLNIARIDWLVVAGIWGATLSSALGSILGAPRILQATAVDKISWKPFAKGVGASNEPRNALLLTFVIAEGGILIGELDVIARVVSIFFITTYGFLNLSAAFEKWTSADFRPDFKVPIWVSLLGAVACIVVMIQLDPLALLGAIVVLGLLFLYLKRQELSLETGDAWSGVWASLVKKGLEKLSSKEVHSRNWRPNIIMFNGDDSTRPHLIELGKNIIGDLGILSGFELVPSGDKLMAKSTTNLNGKNAESAGYFVHQHYCRDIYSGMDEISRVYGFSGVEPNTILMGWSKSEKNREPFAKAILNFRQQDYNTILLDYDADKKYGNYQSIDIWWSGSGQDFALAVSLIRHITSSSAWKACSIRLLIINMDAALKDRIYSLARKVLENYRVNVKIQLIENGIEKIPEREIIKKESQSTDLTVIGINKVSSRNYKDVIDRTEQLLDGLGTTILIGAASTFEEISIGIGSDTAPSRIPEEDVALTLPELYTTFHSQVNIDLRKIDEYGSQSIQRFFNKSFLPIFKENIGLIDTFRSITNSTISGLRKAATIENHYRKRKAIVKTENDFIFRVRREFEALKDAHLNHQQELLDEAIGQYIERMDKDIERFPLRLSLDYPQSAAIATSGDSADTKSFKFKKRLRATLTGKNTIGHQVRYREIANYYLNQSRNVFLSALLQEFEMEHMKLMAGLKAIVSVTTAQLEAIELKAVENALETEAIDSAASAIDTTLASLEQQFSILPDLFRNRFLLDFRKNLNAMGQHMEDIDINRFSAKKRRGRKQYQNIKEENLTFADHWLHNLRLFVNGNFLDLCLFMIKNRIKEGIEDYDKELSHTIDLKYSKKLQELSKEVDVKLNSELVEEKLSFEFEVVEEIDMVTGFNETYELINGLIKGLPESIDIANDEVSGEDLEASEAKRFIDMEAVSIPVERIAAHFVESHFANPVQQRLREASAFLRNHSLTVKEIVSLTNFNLENLEEEVNREEHVKTTLLRALQGIDSETEKAKIVNDQLSSEIRKHLAEAFEPLSSYVIIKNAGDFVQQARDYKSKKVISKVGNITQKGRKFLIDRFINLLYRRSEGVLLAKEITEDKKNEPVMARTLDLLEQVSPDQGVYEKLPIYYKNLFSGKSSISNDFWIDRPLEKEKAGNAIKRYKSGHKGGILVLGERNSGKTSFCKHLATAHFPEKKVFQVFPPKGGAIVISAFEEALRRATGLTGNLHNIIQNLPKDSVLILNDLELWWLRSDKGHSVLQQLMGLILRYSEDCLFLVNCNPYSFHLINQLYPIEDNFIAAIHCKPFVSEEIKNLIMLRHHSSGLKFVLGKEKEESFSGLQQAKLFHEYFKYSLGNPGMALNAWLAHIKDVKGKIIVIAKPNIPDRKILEKMDDDWKVYVLQLILHKHLTLEKLSTIMGTDRTHIRHILSAMIRAGIVVEKSRSIYSLNEYLEPHIIEVFQENDIL